MEAILFLVLGLVIGVISAFLGLGGGIIIVPLLPELAQLSATEAVATSLFTIFLVVSNNCRSFHKKGWVVWSVALLIGPFTAVGAFMSGRLALWIPDIYLRGFLALLLSFVLIKSVYRLWLASKPSQQDLKAEFPFSKTKSGVTGVFAGLLSGISGIGAGLVVSPLLLNMKIVKNEEVSPTANGVMIFTTFFGALAFLDFQSMDGWKWGAIHLDKSLLIAMGAWTSSYFARPRQQKLPANWRGGLLTTLLALLMGKMWWEVLQKLLS